MPPPTVAPGQRFGAKLGASSAFMAPKPACCRSCSPAQQFRAQLVLVTPQDMHLVPAALPSQAQQVVHAVEDEDGLLCHGLLSIIPLVSTVNR
jgi:hypothetical protein